MTSCESSVYCVVQINKGGRFIAVRQETKLWHLRKSISITGLWRDKLTGRKRQLAAFLQCDWDGGGGVSVSVSRTPPTLLRLLRDTHNSQSIITQKMAQRATDDVFLHWYERLGLVWSTIWTFIFFCITSSTCTPAMNHFLAFSMLSLLLIKAAFI